MRMRWMVSIIGWFALALVPVGAAQAADSASLYKTKCALCHGADGAGKSTMKNTELRTSEVQEQTDAQLQEAVANGKGKMPAYKGKLSKEQLASLVTYIRILRGAPKAAIAAESKAKPAEAEKPAKTGEKAAAAKTSEKPAASETSNKSTRTEMEAMHKEHLEAMKAQIQKLHADLDRMKASVDQVADASEKARWQANVDMWQVMVDHLDQMLKHMEAMPGMGGGMMHHPPAPPAKPE